ncbi:MAG TPA: hypothetical protein DCR24_07800 [Bacillus bacterium]|nr:hypothetical protein [Bacillus sp. (in: firmicutes)]
MVRNKRWFPFIASAGIGAVTYYTMSRTRKFGNVDPKSNPVVGGNDYLGQQSSESNNTPSVYND